MCRKTSNIDTCLLQIENHILHFRDRARSKCGTFDYLDHIPLGGDKKVLQICIHTMFTVFLTLFECTNLRDTSFSSVTLSVTTTNNMRLNEVIQHLHKMFGTFV